MQVGLRVKVVDMRLLLMGMMEQIVIMVIFNTWILVQANFVPYLISNLRVAPVMIVLGMEQFML